MEMIDSDIMVARDTAKVDCYLLVADDAGHGPVRASVSATLLTVLAEAVQAQGEDVVRHTLENVREGRPYNGVLFGKEWIETMEGEDQ